MTEQLRTTISKEFKAKWKRARLVAQDEDQLVAQNSTNENVKMKENLYILFTLIHDLCRRDKTVQRKQLRRSSY